VLTNKNKSNNPPPRGECCRKPKTDLLLIEYEQDFNKPTQGPMVTACEYNESVVMQVTANGQREKKKGRIAV
jgi:hypothetical protein